MSPNTRGAVLMMASMAAFTFNDACVKVVGETLPLFQLLTLRGIISSVLIYLLARHLGALSFRIPRRDWGLIAARCLSEVAAAYFFLTALLNMPLANLTAVLLALPLTVTFGAALLFGEAIGWRRMAAILVGFCGMLLIVRPEADGINIFAIYALLAALSVTVRDLVTRRMSPEVPSLTVTFFTSAAVLLFAVIGLVGETWVPMTASLWALIVASAIFVLGGYLFSVAVMRVGDVAFVAPFRYTSLIWALALGWLVFGDWPDPITMLGAAIIVATGLFTLYRDRMAKAP